MIDTSRSESKPEQDWNNQTADVTTTSDGNPTSALTSSAEFRLSYGVRQAQRQKHPFWHRFRRHRLAVIGSAVWVVLIVMAIFAPILAPVSPYEIDIDAIRQGPTWHHLLGTDESGRDVLSRIIYGSRISLKVGIVTAAISLAIGTAIGLVSGYAGGRTDFWLMRLTETVMTIPAFIIIVAIVASLGPNITNVIIVLAVFSWTGVARLVRAETLSVREREYILAARCVGVPSQRILIRHILPSVSAPVIVAATFAVAGAILTEAALSFLGVGVQIPIPAWGNMLSSAQSLPILEGAPWLWIPPGFMITISVLSLNFMGDALRDALDTRMQS